MVSDMRRNAVVHGLTCEGLGLTCEGLLSVRTNRRVRDLEAQVQNQRRITLHLPRLQQVYLPRLQHLASSQG